MTSFDEILKKTLEDVNGKFYAAQTDLFSNFEELSAAIKNNIGIEIEIALSVTEQNVNSTIYRLTIDTAPQDTDAPRSVITSFKIPNTGYPISFGTYLKAMENFRATDEVNNSTELKDYFTGLLADPDSKLIQTIGFAIRRAKSTDPRP